MHEAGPAPRYLLPSQIFAAPTSEQTLQPRWSSKRAAEREEDTPNGRREPDRRNRHSWGLRQRTRLRGHLGPGRHVTRRRCVSKDPGTITERIIPLRHAPGAPIFLLPLALALLPLCAASTARMDPGQLQAALVRSATEGQELIGSGCARVKCPSAAEFLRDFVLPNKPCVITGLMDDWPARHCWSPEYLCTALGEKSVSINVTPNGRGDAVTSDGYFAMPEERTMTFAEFVATLRDKSTDEVCYLSHQNDNLRTQLGDARAGSSLAQDVPASIPFVDEALGHPPDAVGFAAQARVCFPKVALPSLLAPDLAPHLSSPQPNLMPTPPRPGRLPPAMTPLCQVNLWFGDERAVTTLHKDHYENMYAVVSGRKEFTLYPPCVLPLLYPRSYPAKAYQKVEDRWRLVESKHEKPGSLRTWISVDPEQPDYDRYPLFRHARATRVVVEAGEVLYLPVPRSAPSLVLLPRVTPSL